MCKGNKYHTSFYNQSALSLSVLLERIYVVNIICCWWLKGGRRQDFVYSSHDIVWRAHPDVLLWITVGLRISLRSLYPKTFENMNHDLLKFLSYRLLTMCCFLETFLLLGSHLPSLFGVWDDLLCCLVSFSI